MALFTEHPFRHVIKGVLLETSISKGMSSSPDTMASDTRAGDGTSHHENDASLHSQVYFPSCSSTELSLSNCRGYPPDANIGDNYGHRSPHFPVSLDLNVYDKNRLDK